MKLLFPERPINGSRKQLRYWDTYYKYTLDLFAAAGCSVEFGPEIAVGSGRYLIHLDDMPVMIDYWDLLDLDEGFEKYPVYFKFHYSKEHHGSYPNVFPFSPISFYDWQQYTALSQSINYSSKSNFILNRQHPHANALERRRMVQNKLLQHFGLRVQTNQTNQRTFWGEVAAGLVSICVPGYRNNMLDRGQWQYMAFGACTLSPPLLEVLPTNSPLVADEHYVACAADYSDLIDKVNWCEANRNRCQEIGDNAKALFQDSATPEAVFSYVQSTISTLEFTP